MLNRCLRTIIILTLVLIPITGTTASPAHAQAPALEMFTDAGSSNAIDSISDQPFESRSRLVRLNLVGLFDSSGTALDSNAIPVLNFNLFPGVSFAGLVTQVQKTPGQIVWVGNLNDVPQSYFYMVSTGGAFIAHIGSTEGIFEVSLVSGDIYKIVQINQSSLGEDAPGEIETSGSPSSAGDLPTTADSSAQIDIMVIYTTTARIAEGSTSAMNARIALAVTETNQAYVNSGVASRLRLVHTEEVAYQETGNLSTDLNRLVSPTDGYLDGIHNLRNIYGADMVALIVNNGGGYCGLAKAILAAATTAFQVTARPGCMTGDYSFGHEFAHLQGARHDTYVDPNTSPFAYGHGYVNIPSLWRTVMAYNNACSAVGKNCTRLQYFSNPARLYGGIPMGAAGVSENYKVLNSTALTVANFRQTVIASNFSSTFTNNSLGWIPVNGTWSLVNSNYYYSPGVQAMLTSVKHGGLYGDFIYSVIMKRTGSNTSLPSNIIIRGQPGSLTARGEWKPSYLFEYTNSGMFSVWKFNSVGTFTALKPWTFTTAITQGGWNVLQVVANGSMLKFYINKILVYSGSDASLRVGQVGIGMYRDALSTGNQIYVDGVNMVNSPTTADLKLDEKVSSGAVVPGGNPSLAPQK